MYIYNGKVINIDLPNTLNGYAYPSGWFYDAAARSAAGIESIATPDMPVVDSKYKTHLDITGSKGNYVAKWVIEQKTQAELDAEATTLADAIADASTQAYLDVDAVTTAAVGSRTEEYRVAEEDARAFAANGYVGEVGINISSYALYNPTGEAKTNKWAADSIIARADAMRVAQSTMRAKRFEYQAKMRSATSSAQLASVVAEWTAFITGVRSALKL